MIFAIKKKKMNTTQAKEISIFKFLQSQGIYPEYTKGSKAFYNSPLRDEKTPSFNIDTQKNIWYDYGTAEGGKIIDLVTKMFGISVSKALEKLSDTNFQSNIISFSFYKQNSVSTGIEIKHIQPIQNKALIQYLATRKIPLHIAKNYLQEAYYLANNKKYFALAFKNNKGGYELRNKYFKGGTSPKYYTSIISNTKSLNIFEGVYDFLSALVYYKASQPNNDTIDRKSVV